MINYSKTPTYVNFASFMSLPDADSGLNNMFDVLSDCGLHVVADVERLLDGPDDDVEFSLSQLAAEMRACSEWIDGKLQAFERLQATSVRAIWETADIREPLSVEYLGQKFTGDWCRSDGAIFVCHNGIVDASPASTWRRKRDRTRTDRWSAERMLLDLVEAGARQAIAA